LQLLWPYDQFEHLVFNRSDNGKTKTELAHVIKPKQNIQPIVPLLQKQDSLITPKNIEVAIVKTPKQKPQLHLNPKLENEVKEVERKDVMEQLDLLDENTVAEFVSAQNPEIKIVPQEEYLNDQMLNYILDDNIDPSDIKKLPWVQWIKFYPY